MKIRVWQKVSLAVALFIFCTAAAALAGEPFDLVKSAVERARSLLRDPTLNSAEKKKERIERLKEVINPLFDYDEMARRTLAAHWRRRTLAEQEEFARLFRAFLERIYSDRIDLYGGEWIVLGHETVDQEYAEVESKIIGAKGEESLVTYRLLRNDGKWKVYDAVVENISIVNNYRSQFDRVISKSSYEELKKTLRDKAG
jgi:phospholipid transport system substrate-binding protein